MVIMALFLHSESSHSHSILAFTVYSYLTLFPVLNLIFPSMNAPQLMHSQTQLHLLVSDS